jgi:hypothetical protein
MLLNCKFLNRILFCFFFNSSLYFRSTPPPLPEVFNKADDDTKNNTQIAS